MNTAAQARVTPPWCCCPNCQGLWRLLQVLLSHRILGACVRHDMLQPACTATGKRSAARHTPTAQTNPPDPRAAVQHISFQVCYQVPIWPHVLSFLHTRWLLARCPTRCCSSCRTAAAARAPAHAVTPYGWRPTAHSGARCALYAGGSPPVAGVAAAGAAWARACL
jgi:hypothetical protein